MKIFCKTYWLQKKDNEPEEYEDAFAPSNVIIELEKDLSFAIADGASLGFESRKLANILVNNFVEKKNFDQKFLNEVYKIWYDWVKNYIKEREEKNQPLKWYEEKGLMKGPYSTFLGLTFKKEDNYNFVFKAVSVGDSCLFLVREHELLLKFPIQNSLEFNDFPDLISIASIIDNNLIIKNLEDKVLKGDEFFLLTDALSQWFLKEYESNNMPWIILSNIDSKEDFANFIEDLRENGHIKNDDVTFMYIKCG